MRDIAKELHLDEAKVQALEDNRFEELGAPVFAKGYLRKYAELVSVPIDDVLADYYRLNRAVGAPPVVGPRRKRPPAEFSPVPWIAGVVSLLVVAAAAYWWLNRAPAPAGTVLTGSAPPLESESPSGQSMPPAENGSVTQPVPVLSSADAESGGASDAEAAATQPADTSAVEAESPAVESSSLQSPAETDSAGDPVAGSAGAAELQLQLSFSGDCWTEVTDANGGRLYFGLGTDGRNISVSGVPPLRLLLGNNDNVSLLVNGQAYTVQPSELRGNTARLTIAGS
jgi:cytoskeleton protein RodZ